MIKFPEPVISVAVETKSAEDSWRIEQILSALSTEDKLFRFRKGPCDGDFLIEGVGELHLEIILDRLKREVRSLFAARPRIKYFETITAKAAEKSRIHREFDTTAILAECRIELQPAAPGSGVEFRNSLSKNHPASPFLGAIEDGVNLSFKSGPIAQFPVTDV